jgi:hypothetical protein
MYDYVCSLCNYNSNHIGNFRQHIKTKKHQKKTQSLEKICNNISQLTPIDSQLTPIDSQLTPIDSQLTPIDSQLTPIDSQLTPIEKKTFSCKYCKKIYSKNSNLHRHIRKCPYKNNKLFKYSEDSVDQNNLMEYIKIIKQENEIIKKEKDTIEQEKSIMKKEIEKLINRVGATNINIQQNIYINNHGSENLDYLNNQYLTALLKSPYTSIQNLLKTIYFHPNHPENHNIKILNRKEKYAVVYKDGDWELRNKRDVIDNIVDNSYNMMDCYFDDKSILLENNKQQKFLDFQKDYLNNSKTKKNIEKDTELIILNGQKEINNIEINN